MLNLLCLSLLMHPVHESVSEVEWNQATGRLEVAMRLDVLDEQWLRRRADEARRDGDKKKKGDWQLAYLRSRFRISDVKDEKKDPTKYHWVGSEEDGGHIWWFFELEPAERQVPEWVEDRVLFERNLNQANRVLVIGQVPKRTLILTIRHPRAYLYQDEDEQLNETPATGR